MAAGKYNILIQQGADYLQPITIRNSETGVAINLTGAVITGQVREDYTSATPLASFTVQNTDLANGKFTLTIPASTTTTMSFDTGVYDVEVLYASGQKDRLLQGSVVFSPEVTK